ncbi:MAG: AAA family ATPase [Cyclobacteriaceae bacterium]
MELKNFKATNVHGYLNYNINFNPRLTFLIGINGTGKTSVLKLILGLISPSFNYLNSIEFDTAELTCRDKSDIDIIIKASMNFNSNYLDLYLKNGEVEYIGSFEKTNFTLLNNEHSDEANEKLRGLIERFDQQEIVKEIKSLTTPLFLGLDRRVYEGQQIDRMRHSWLIRRRYGNFPQNDPLNISLIDIQEVIYDYMRLIASKQPKINEEFKNKILLQSFEFLETQEFNLWKDARELTDKRKKASDAFNNLNIEGISTHLTKFFDKLTETLNQFNEVQKKRNSKSNIQQKEIEVIQKWFNNQPQLRRIDELIEFNQAYQDEVSKLYLPIEQTKDIINKFFNESKKKLQIDTQGELNIEFANGKIAKLYELSSGEKQIITMLGHLIFFEERFKSDTGIFIIDEPEVSLHLAWQEIFVNSILEASPKTQFILATHSPAILNEFDEGLCEDLAKLN